jgi:hypothetical protein
MRDRDRDYIFKKNDKFIVVKASRLNNTNIFVINKRNRVINKYIGRFIK